MLLDCPPYKAKITPKDWPNLTKFTNDVSPKPIVEELNDEPYL